MKMNKHITLLLVAALLAPTHAMSARKPRKPRPSKAPITKCQPVPEGTQFGKSAHAPKNNTTLWYRRPVTKWTEALPIGNGSFGGMVFGGITSDVLQFNHDTVWTKPPMPKDMDYNDRLPDKTRYIEQARKLIFDGKNDEADRLLTENVLIKGYQWGTYQPFATLKIDYGFDVSKGVDKYRLDLDLATGIARTQFTIGKTDYTRETFVAHDKSVIAIRMTASGPDRISLEACLSRTDQEKTTSIDKDKISISGQAEAMGHAGVRFESIVKTITPDGTVSSKDGILSVKDASEFTLLISGATDYNKSNPFKPLNIDLADKCASLLNDFQDAGWQKSHEAAQAAHGELFNRVHLRLGKDSGNKVPTDELITAAKTGTYDPLLAAQVYQFGRYLLICSSRPGSLPANLQGLWNDRIAPPWYSDYHFNINVQMNYWMADSANLSECHTPFFDLLEGLVAGGQRVASEMFGCRGFLVPHSTGAYFTAIPTGSPPYELWTVGGVWAAQHLMEHYRFTGDKEFLEQRAFPILKETVLFCLDWLVEHPETKKLVAGPDVSPENFFMITEDRRAAVDMGCAMDQQLIWQAFTDFLEAADILGVSDPTAEEVQQALRNLAPTRIGSDGRIMEWSKEYTARVQGHRHLSHLFAFCPGNQYHKNNAPKMMAAAKKSVEHRLAHPGGAGKSGWSAAWINCLHARFGMPEKAYQSVAGFLENNLYPNMLAVYKPDLFQIDGNFGYSLALTEMFLQSHAGEIELLPALPKAWSEGEISGLVARGGFVVSIKWKDGKLTNADITSKLGNPCTVRYGNKTAKLVLKRGEERSLGETLSL